LSCSPSLFLFCSFVRQYYSFQSSAWGRGRERNMQDIMKRSLVISTRIKFYQWINSIKDAIKNETLWNGSTRVLRPSQLILPAGVLVTVARRLAYRRSGHMHRIDTLLILGDLEDLIRLAALEDDNCRALRAVPA